MKRILITGTGGDVGTGIIKCILSGMPQAILFSCDIKPIVPYLNHFEKHFIVPRYDSENYSSIIQKICLDYEITHFFPTTEPEILIASKHRNFFKQSGIALVINNKRILEIATSKHKTAALLRENGILVPDTYLPEDLPTIIEYPLIVKPNFGRGSAHLKKVYNPQELREALKAVSFPVVQQYVGTEEHEYTVGVFSDGKNTRSISYRRALGRGSMSVFVEVVQVSMLKDIAHRVAQLFNLKGAFNIQLRLQDHQYYIFEINPRISSTVSFRHQMGFQDVIWWLQILSGEPLTDYCKTKAGVIGIKLESEQIFSPPFNNIENVSEE